MTASEARRIAIQVHEDAKALWARDREAEAARHMRVVERPDVKTEERVTTFEKPSDDVLARVRKWAETADASYLSPGDVRVVTSYLFTLHKAAAVASARAARNVAELDDLLRIAIKTP